MADILGGFEQAVLLSLIKLGKDAYGRAIIKEAAVCLKRDVAAGAVYATLERLETKGHHLFLVIREHTSARRTRSSLL